MHFYGNIWNFDWNFKKSRHFSIFKIKSTPKNKNFYGRKVNRTAFYQFLPRNDLSQVSLSHTLYYRNRNSSCCIFVICICILNTQRLMNCMQQTQFDCQFLTPLSFTIQIAQHSCAIRKLKFEWLMSYNELVFYFSW